MTHFIRIASAIINDQEGKTLVVRKKGTLAFMQAGGKIEDGETPLDALRRELKEELNLRVLQQDTEFVGQFEAPAANERECVVVADVFRLHVENAKVEPNAEIEEIAWIEPNNPPDIVLAPLTKNHILPVA